MTISTYHVENVLKAYSKQTGVGASVRAEPENPTRHTDVVTLSSGSDKKEAFERISYSLLDILLKSEKSV